MLYKFLYSLKDIFFGFNVFRYITFRVACAGITAFLISVIMGPFLIRMLTRFNMGENIRQESVEEIYSMHKHKQGTPTMGGILILLGISVSVLLWGDLSNRYVLLVLFSTLWLGIVGFIDDYIKLLQKHHKGLGVTAKLAGQTILGLIAGIILFMDPQVSTVLDIPFFKNVIVDLGAFYILFVILVVVSSSNAVNLTDGLDGLAIGCISIVALTYGVMSYVVGNIKFSGYLFITYVPGVGELSVYCAALIGAALGFLWFNAYPAEIFMGDVGALALGGGIGVVAACIKKELLLVIVGGVFVAEAFSVLLQVLSYKMRRKRIFLMAPFHHHLQIKGWSETKIVVRLWIVAIILALFSLATLKLR